MAWSFMVSYMLFTLSPVYADDTASGTAAADSNVLQENALPKCFNEDSDLNKIRDYQRNNAKSRFKYLGYIQVFDKSVLGDEEILARLVYAETLAAHCDQQQEDMAVQTIAEVILRRIEKRSGQIREVIFERDQFASSLNLYQESSYMNFLCPKFPALWKKTKKMIRLFTSGNKRNSLPKAAYNYYLFKHSTRFKPPKWTGTFEEVRTVQSTAGSVCLAAYSNPQWK